jgi:hypothetical protein
VPPAHELPGAAQPPYSGTCNDDFLDALAWVLLRHEREARKLQRLTSSDRGRHVRNATPRRRVIPTDSRHGPSLLDPVNRLTLRTQGRHNGGGRNLCPQVGLVRAWRVRGSARLNLGLSSGRDGRGCDGLSANIRREWSRGCAGATCSEIREEGGQSVALSVSRRPRRLSSTRQAAPLWLKVRQRKP